MFAKISAKIAEIRLNNSYNKAAVQLNQLMYNSYNERGLICEKNTAASKANGLVWALEKDMPVNIESARKILADKKVRAIAIEGARV